MKVELLRHCGTDLDVANNARVSFGKESKELTDKDKHLISFLARGMTTSDFDTFLQDVGDTGLCWLYYEEDKRRQELIDLLRKWRETPTHWAPFANGISATFRIKAPIFVARQLDKHQVGFTKSEVSRRYVSSDPDFYTPEAWRLKADNVKQGSSSKTTGGWGFGMYKGLVNNAISTYKDMLDYGVCPEQARMILPQSMYTEWVWTSSLYGWARLCQQRCDRNHAQRETADVADMIADHCSNLWPVSWKELVHVN